MIEKNARFWVYVNDGWVKLTLRPGEGFQWVEGGPTDEGYDYTGHHWYYAAPFVKHAAQRDAKDCDGRINDSYRSVCHVERLAACPVNDSKELPTPDWKCVGRGHRDYAAERMGY